MVGRSPMFMTILCVSKSAAGRLSLSGVRLRLAHLQQEPGHRFVVTTFRTYMKVSFSGPPGRGSRLLMP